MKDFKDYGFELQMPIMLKIKKIDDTNVHLSLTKKEVLRSYKKLSKQLSDSERCDLLMFKSGWSKISNGGKK